MRNYSSELDRRVRDTLFDRMVKRADELVTRERTTNMDELQDAISALVESIDSLTNDMRPLLQADTPKDMSEAETPLEGDRSELCESLLCHVSRILNMTDTVKNIRERLDLP